jgi:hypothetical protein
MGSHATPSAPFVFSTNLSTGWDQSLFAKNDSVEYLDSVSRAYRRRGNSSMQKKYQSAPVGIVDWKKTTTNGNP